MEKRERAKRFTPSGVGTLQTLGDLKQAGYRLFGNCNAGHGWQLDTDTLIAEFGAAYVFIKDRRITQSRTCPRCGRPCSQLTVQPS